MAKLGKADNTPCSNEGVILTCSVVYNVKSSTGIVGTLDGDSKSADLHNEAEPFNPKDCKAEVKIPSDRSDGNIFVATLSDSLKLKGLLTDPRGRYLKPLSDLFTDKTMGPGTLAEIEFSDPGQIFWGDEIYQRLTTRYTCTIK